MASDAYNNGRRDEMQRLRQWAFEPRPIGFHRWQFDRRYFLMFDHRGPLLAIMDDFGTLRHVVFESDMQDFC